jgi:Phosphate-selective porin O and P
VRIGIALVLFSVLARTGHSQEVPAPEPVSLVAPADPKPADPKPVVAPPPINPLADSLHQDDNYGFKSLFDSLHPATKSGKKWYEKLNLRGYSQFRYARTLEQDLRGAEPNLLGDRSINGTAENFSIRRNRLIFFGDVSDHLSIYIQPDFAAVIPGSNTSVFFAQLRDLYGDVHLDTDRVHRFRVGLSKVPYGFENLQSSQNRLPLDRTDGINTGVSPNERDLGVFYYWTPKEKQQLLRDLVDGGLKGSGNYGILGLGFYNGQGGQLFEQNLNMHTVARFTWPWQFENGQVLETSVQAYTGEYLVEGTNIRALGTGPAITPAGTRASGDRMGQIDRRIAATLVYYPQPFGFQAEWNWGTGPGLNDAQTAVVPRSLHGGYAMAMFKVDTHRHGLVTPYVRWQYFRGGYRSVANAPFGTHEQLDLGVEWQIFREMELVLEYSFVDGVNLSAINTPGITPYRNFDGSVIRAQFQLNY